MILYVAFTLYSSNAKWTAQQKGYSLGHRVKIVQMIF